MLFDHVRYVIYLMVLTLPTYTAPVRNLSSAEEVFVLMFTLNTPYQPQCYKGRSLDCFVIGTDNCSIFQYRSYFCLFPRHIRSGVDFNVSVTLYKTGLVNLSILIVGESSGSVLVSKTMPVDGSQQQGSTVNHYIDFCALYFIT